MEGIRAKQGFVLFLFLFILVFHSTASAQSDEEKNFLLMYFKEDELQVVSATRSLKPISRVAENMTVITADDIERMNAHTLADVLNTVNGVQVQFAPPSPGNNAVAMIQGSDQKHVTVLVDGVPLNQLAVNIANVGYFPVQHIGRIEIIKGPASSAWGSALGGVINIITKEPPDKGIGGTVSGSYGSNHTEDYRAEAGARSGPFGMYLYAGGLHTKGFAPSTGASNNHLYSKLTYTPLQGTDVKFNFFYQKSRAVLGNFSEFDAVDKDREEQYYGSLSITSRITDDITLDVAAWAKRRKDTLSEDIMSTGESFFSNVFDDRRYGFNARAAWKLGDQTIVAGTEFNRDILKSNVMIDGKQTNDKWAVFLNDTIAWGDLAVTPGVRYEVTDIGGSAVSPSLGATYAVTMKSILRANVAKGFYTPSFIDKFGFLFGDFISILPNPDLRVEKVWSYQAGFETAELKYVWLKASLFRHDITDIIDASQALSVNSGEQRRQGFELEMKSMTFHNMYLSAGTTYIHAEDRTTGEVIRRIPKYTYDAALNYDDRKSFRAMLKGRYVWWNWEGSDSRYSSVIVDLTMAKTLFKKADHTCEVFASAHNMFNGRQDTGFWYKTPSRWAEMGLRYKF